VIIFSEREQAMNHEQKNLPEYWQETAASEIARLYFGHPYIIDALGSLLPEAIDLSTVWKVLDIGCGTGEWARRLAKEHPEIHIIGIDTSLHLIHEAVRLAVEEKLDSVSFYQFGTAQSLDFPGESFDVVHAHSLASFISNAMWSRILEEMIRLVKPGGWLNLVDYEHGTTSSEAFNRLAAMGMEGVRALGGGASPTSPNLGGAVRLYSYLVDAGMLDVAYTVHMVDFGVNSHPNTRAFLDDFMDDMLSFKPFVLQLGLTDERTFDTLLEQTKIDLYRPDSCGYAYLISAIGRKNF
jgi:ubiquinone/menaquinone biosynthesis C-methylase UbiE